MQTVYLDHNATTPVFPEVVEAMDRIYAERLANPASQHLPGQHARRVLEDARRRIASLLGADLDSPEPDRLILTASATEANNLALLGMARALGGPPGKVIISSIEHSSVIEPAEALLEDGWRLETLPVTPQGVIRTEMLPRLLDCGAQRAAPRLVSVILANHETGVLQPVGELAALCAEQNVPMHTDAAQVVGKLPVDFRRLGVAAMSFGAHKFGGPVGIGGLLLRHDTPIRPIIFGGHHQDGLRPGTECVALAVGMATALEICAKRCEEHLRRMAALRDRFEAGLKSNIPEIVIHGSDATRLPQTSNIAFPQVDGQVLLLALSMAGVACSAGAACSSGSSEVSPTLLAMGVPPQLAASSLRFSLGTTTTEAEIDEAVARITRVWRELTGK